MIFYLLNKNLELEFTLFFPLRLFSFLTPQFLFLLYTKGPENRYCMLIHMHQHYCRHYYREIFRNQRNSIRMNLQKTNVPKAPRRPRRPSSSKKTRFKGLTPAGRNIRNEKDMSVSFTKETVILSCSKDEKNNLIFRKFCWEGKSNNEG